MKHHAQVKSDVTCVAVLPWSQQGRFQITYATDSNELMGRGTHMGPGLPYRRRNWQPKTATARL